MQSIRKWDITNPETKKKCIQLILTSLDEVDNIEVGAIFAETLMQTVAEVIGPDIYNRALVDARKVVASKLQDLEVDLDVLTQ